MKLQTIVDIPASTWKIGYEDRILMLGSCFSDEISAQMIQRALQVTCNPFGTLYNPLSIAQALTMTGMPEVIHHDGLYHSMAHHGSFSRAEKAEAEQAVKDSIHTMQKAIKEATIVIVTFGTALVYEMNGEVVGNCHKLPENRFVRRRLSVAEIVAAWKPILERYPDKHWLFTVSPIRHIRDGLHENQLSKSILLQAIDQMVNDQCHYFPSYEIMQDELRDYRFYADDLVHPSSLAVQYIWERFVECFCTPQTQNEMVLQHKRWKYAQHIPLHS